MIRPAGTSPEDKSWDALTAEEKLGKFTANGLARIPKAVSDKIIADAAGAGSPELQVEFITQQAAAWQRINMFRESEGAGDIPQHFRMALIQRLSDKHGESWKDMLPELDEQVAASARVMELRLKGIPGMTADESQEFLIEALEKHAPDYKSILSIAEERAGK